MTRRQADLTLVLATLIWGMAFPVVKVALASATPLAFLAARFGVASVLLLPFIRFNLAPSRGEVLGGLVLGALVAVGFITQTVGLVSTTPARSAFIVAISSVIAPIVAFAVLGQRPRWLTAAALVIAGLGMYLLTAPDAGGLNTGDIWTLGCAVCFGGQIVAVTELSRRYDVGRLVWLQLVATAVVSGLALPLFEEPRIRWTPAFAGAFAYLVLFPSAVAFALQARAQRHMSSARAALIFCLEPVFAGLASWLWLGERLSAAQWAGGGLIMVGMVVADLPLGRALSTVTQPTDHG